MKRIALLLALAPTLALAQTASGGVDYAYDDGSASVNIGPPSSFDPDMLWGNYYLTEPGGEVLTEVSVAFGGTFPSLANGPVTFWVLDDPDADGDPRNATALMSVQATPDIFGNTYFSVPIPETTVSGAFFVGASALLAGGQDRPARVDTDARADRSWFFYAPDIAATIDDLASAPFGARMDSLQVVPFPGAFMVRATGQPISTDTAPAPEASGARLTLAGPHPVATSTSLRLHLGDASEVSLVVTDALGRRVARLADGAFARGEHRLTWDASGLAPGFYVAHLRAGDAVHSLRLIVAR